MASTLKGLLTLSRPANLPTAMADILAGTALAGAYAAMAGSFIPSAAIQVLQLLAASVCLYAGGVVLNDVFDLALDKVERPERPIPSGVVSRTLAALYGTGLLLAGILLAFLVSSTAGLVALALAGSIVLYDSISKKNGFFGPLNMGICRGLNLILGIAIFSDLSLWYYAFIPITYIFAITLISRGEVHGNNKGHIVRAGILYVVVIVLTIVYLLLSSSSNYILVILFLLLFAVLIFRPLVAAHQENSPMNIRKAVMSGVISIIALDASIAAGYSPWWVPVLMLLLFPISMSLARFFAVT